MAAALVGRIGLAIDAATSVCCHECVVKLMIRTVEVSESPRTPTTVTIK